MMSFHGRKSTGLQLFIILTVLLKVFEVESFTKELLKLPVFDKFNLHRGNHKPHIVAIIADDLGWNDVSFHGSNQIPTPNIDALAANGIILNRHYVLPTCTPSRTAYLTGRYPLRTGMQGYPLKAGERWGIPLNNTLFPEHLSKLGYKTKLIGKWHVGYYSVGHTPTHRGFDDFVGYYSGYVKYFNHTISQNDFTGYDLHRDTKSTSDVYRTSKYFTDIVTKEVENAIQRHDPSVPLYLQIAHLAPHSGEPDDPLEVWNIDEVNKKFGYIKDINRRKFAGMLYRLDQSIGRTVQALKNAKMLQDSIIVFISDNGAQTEGLHENFGSNYPLRGLKFSMFDGGVRGAACIYSPLLKNVSRVSHELMHITDWMPTLYSAAGGNIADLGIIDGFNQWPALKYGEKSPRESLILNVDEVQKIAGAVGGDFKLLKGFQPEYTEFYGDDGVGDGYPSYDANAVVKSDVGNAIAQISACPVTAEKIIQLRKAAQMSCPPHDHHVNCTDTCLFKLDVDPCETNDVSRQHPEVVRVLEGYITLYSLYLKPQSQSKIDPASSPYNFGGVWMPWVK